MRMKKLKLQVFLLLIGDERIEGAASKEAFEHAIDQEKRKIKNNSLDLMQCSIDGEYC